LSCWVARFAHWKCNQIWPSKSWKRTGFMCLVS
jgi:hypothetical protein